MTISGNTPAPLLDARQLRIPAIDMHPSVRLDLQLYHSELVLLHCSEKTRTTAIADALLGLGAQADSVFYREQSWSAMGQLKAQQARRSIARIQSSGNWMESSSVMDNILLPLMHHTIVPEQILRASASDLARRFGLPGLPQDLPADCPAPDLERCACVRAFLGRPELAILEYPLQNAGTDSLPALVSSIQQVRRRNGAVLWITANNTTLGDNAIPADRRYRLLGSQLLELEPDHANA